MKKQRDRIYTIATAHLDTSWLWTYEKSIEEYIPDTFTKNLDLLDKYPEYNFNFEGSLRYELLKEYYPDLYERLKGYIASGRWNPCGACYENGDVNIPSPEALTRNIIYGNGFFEAEFGKASNDIFIPDCFGFGRALPSVAAHSGLTGFSTCKLPWGAAVDIPFDIGFWRGPDGKGVWSAINPFSYTTIMKDVRGNKRITDKLDDNKKKYGLNKTFVYHGNGDRGGAPKESSIKVVVDSARQNEQSDIEVLSATTKEFFDDIVSMDEEKKNALPVWESEFLMTRHGTGSYTSRTVTKRWNRRCELLADAAERFTSAATLYGLRDYPSYGFDAAWKKVIAHHFHDDITGTSFEECYKRSYSDYVQSMNTFSAEYTASCKALSGMLDTSFVKGIPVVVSNPCECESTRKEAVSVYVDSSAENHAVYDSKGNALPSQTRTENGRTKVTFIADVPSCGLAVFDVVSCDKKDEADTGLSVGKDFIENRFVKVAIDNNGDIASVFDKRLGKELLSAPVKTAILNNVHSFDWPAWEIKYEDIKEAPYMYPAAPEIEIIDNGSALCSVKITRKANNSVFTSVIPLDSESEFVSVYNETDWREEASLLKTEFRLAASNENANYDIGLGYTKRGNNTEKLYEVPAQKWADITDKNGGFGVSVFSDSRTGWDKPDDSTLRLTCIHTPLANYRHECAQHIMDMGLNRYSYAIFGHEGNPSTVSAYADRFCQPMHTFVTDKHNGAAADFSFVRVNNGRVRISAIKKAQKNDNTVIRFVETAGENQKNVVVEFSAPVKQAFIVSGDEKILGDAAVSEGKLIFDAAPSSINSFMLVFEDVAQNAAVVTEKISLEYTDCGITENENRALSTLKGGISVPAEILPESFEFAGVSYAFSAQQRNCIACNGQKIKLPVGSDTLNLLMASLDGDVNAGFICGENVIAAVVQSHEEAPGMWDLMMEKITGYIKPYPQAFTATHTHSADKDIVGKQFYFYVVSIPVSGVTEVKLPVNKNLIVFDAVAVKNDQLFIKGDEHFDTLEKRSFDYSFSEYAQKHARRGRIEKVLDKFFDRTFCVHFVMEGCYNKNSLGDLYYIINNKVIDGIKNDKRKNKVIESRKGR